jgi:hypothetical protein
MQRLITVVVWTIASCLLWLLIAVVQGHAGCILGMPSSVPMTNPNPLTIQATKDAIDRMCRAPRDWFYAEVGATLVVAAAFAISRRKT